MPKGIYIRKPRPAHNFKDLVGQRFGKRIVISREPTPVYNGRKGSSMWLVRCECGKESTLPTSNVKNTTSCGCDESYTIRSGETRKSPVSKKIRDNEGHRRIMFGLSPEMFEEMRIKQDNKCWICQKEFTRTPHIDHNHSCCPGPRSCGKCIRGLLCHSCNCGLGNFHDDLNLMQRAMDYLRK